MKLSPRNMLIVIAAAIVVVLIAVAALVVYPAITSLDVVRAEVDAEVQKESQARALLEQRRAVKDRALETNAAYLQLAQAVPENPELPSLIIELQDLAYEDDVILRSVTTAPLIKPANMTYVEVPLELKVWADWQDTVDYMQHLSKMSRYLRIVSFESVPLPPGEIETAKTLGDDKVGELEDYVPVTTLKIKAFVIQPAEAAAAAPAVPAPAQ